MRYSATVILLCSLFIGSCIFSSKKPDPQSPENTPAVTEPGADAANPHIVVDTGSKRTEPTNNPETKPEATMKKTVPPSVLPNIDSTVVN